MYKNKWDYIPCHNKCYKALIVYSYWMFYDLILRLKSLLVSVCEFLYFSAYYTVSAPVRSGVIFQTCSIWIENSQKCMTKSFDPPALFPSAPLSSAGSEALTFSQCFWNEGWGIGSLVPLQYIPDLRHLCFLPQWTSSVMQKWGFSKGGRLWSRALSPIGPDS